MYKRQPISGMGQRGEDGGLGPNNVGLLARTWGRVTDVDPSGFYFWIDDGSGPVKVITEGLDEPVGEPYVVVTGLSALDASDGPVRGAIRPRTQADIEEL